MPEDETPTAPDEDAAGEPQVIAAEPTVGAKAARAADKKARMRMQAGEVDDDSGPLRVRLPDVKNKEMFAIADQLLGASKMIAMCEDGKSRMARIPGKMKRRQWIKPGDLIILRPWDIDDSKADVKFRYIRTQSAQLSRRGVIPEILDGEF